MFLTESIIRDALPHLEVVHPLYGITFLACKRSNLPVGRLVKFPISRAEEGILEDYYKPNKTSTYYYQVFKTADPSQRWLSHRYPSTGSQGIRYRGKFNKPFLHEGRQLWGWAEDYVTALGSLLEQGKRVPAFYLAIWLYRERSWPNETTAADIVGTFLTEFLITKEEAETLFDTTIPDELDPDLLFGDEKISWDNLRKFINPPPDAPQEESGTLVELDLEGVGPAKRLRFLPAERLSLITGDNGLGKTFLLECAWWALTGQWAGLPAYPRQDAKAHEPKISFLIADESMHSDKIAIPYDWTTQSWPSPKKRPTIPGLLIYARVDGSFAVWDPAKRYLLPQSGTNGGVTPSSFVLTRDQVWNGERAASIEGLISDWFRWQIRPERSPFETFKKVLQRLSPPYRSDLGTLEPGEPVRLPGADARDIPTLNHPYGVVPIVHASAGVRRIITLAYLIVWAWEDHKFHSSATHKERAKRMVILIDEMEAHLHPQWQRAILPALMDVSEDLGADLQIQIIAATHSPLVMASVEPKFDSAKDKQFALDLVKLELFGSDVILEEKPFVRNGVIDNWLIEAFGLRQPRSLPAERTIEAAKDLQMQSNPTTEEVQKVSEELVRYLAADDGFWPRWVYFAETHGVIL